MDPNGGEHETDEHETLRSAWYSPCSSLRDELYGQSSTAEEEEVFVAVTEDISDGMSTLLWAMNNLAKDGTRVVIARVHSPTRAIHKRKSLLPRIIHHLL